MRELTDMEVDTVAGGWSISIPVGTVHVNLEGSEIIGAYNSAREAMADFFTWWDPAGYYSDC